MPFLIKIQGNITIDATRWKAAKNKMKERFLKINIENTVI